MDEKKGFWSMVKDGFAYGLGGGFGWTIGSELAQFLIRWIKRFVIVIIFGGGWGALTVLHPEPPFKLDNKPAIEKKVEKKAVKPNAVNYQQQTQEVWR